MKLATRVNICAMHDMENVVAWKRPEQFKHFNYMVILTDAFCAESQTEMPTNKNEKYPENENVRLSTDFVWIDF